MRAAALCFGVSISVAALADTKLEIQHTEPGKPAESQAVMITTGKVRMEPSQAGDTVLLFHQSDNTFYAIQNDQKSYMTFDPEKAGEMMDQVSERQKQMMAQLEERMAQMPEAQREQMKAMMSKMGQPMPQMQEKEPTRYEARDDSGSAAGIDCRWYDAFEGAKKVREVCLASRGAMGMDSSDAATMKAMQSSMQSMVKSFGNSGMFQDDMPDGMPVRVRHLDDSGKVSSEQVVSNVSHGALDESLFEVPAGYKKREMPSLKPR